MHYWRLTPRSWGQEDADSQAAMMALMLFENTREAYRQEWKEAHREGSRNAVRDKDESAFAAMRARMRE